MCPDVWWGANLTLTRAHVLSATARGSGAPSDLAPGRQKAAEPRLLFHVASVGGRTVQPAACCSASPPMGGRLALRPGPMRAAGSELGSGVGLFNLRGGQQSAPSATDGCVSAMVTLPSFSHITNVGRNTRSRRPRVSDPPGRCRGLKVAVDFVAVAASELSGTLVPVNASEQLQPLG